jgi:phosphoglucomutase
MENTELQEVMIKAQKWLDGNFDQETKDAVKNMMENNQEELMNSFYQDMAFGTGGIRGIMGPGTNRINIYTIGMATQGLSNYLKMAFAHLAEIKVAIAFDSRNNSRLYAEKAAEIFSANGIKVFIFNELRPVPELSFSIRHLQCQSGVVVTASHNPKEYNGYKVYWEDGGQIIAPHDKNIIAEVNKIKDVNEINFDGNENLIEIIGSEVDDIYTDKIKELSLSPEVIEKQKDLKIVYTPIHGAGVKLVPMALKKFGFTNVYNVPEQDIPDGNFPTVHSPNPEESAALDLAMQKAKLIDADLVLASDPDADRVGIATKNDKGELILFNGNQTASVLIYYLVKKWSDNGLLKGREYLIKTIVTTELIAKIANHFEVEYYDVLTGFKFIADVMKKNEGSKKFIGGGEESYGYLAGEFVRDKDAVIACALIAEATAWAREQGKSLYELLMDIYVQFGLYKEKLISMVRQGKSGAKEIKAIMDDLRENPPSEIAGSRVTIMKDYLKSVRTDKITGETSKIELPVSNVLQFFTEDGSKISARPSGTEPKIKFYFGVKDQLDSASNYETVAARLDEKIEKIIQSLEI